MTKMLFVAKKRADLTDDQFITYWQQVHAPLVAKMPGLRQYVINVGLPSSSLTTGLCDGIAEIWFDSQAALQDSLASKEGQAWIADIGKFCSPASGTIVVEEIDVLRAVTPGALITCDE